MHFVASLPLPSVDHEIPKAKTNSRRHGARKAQRIFEVMSHHHVTSN
jgi:hypothetical protein